MKFLSKPHQGFCRHKQAYSNIYGKAQGESDFDKEQQRGRLNLRDGQVYSEATVI